VNDLIAEDVQPIEHHREHFGRVAALEAPSKCRR
jgi:hypothetical protein